MSEASQSGQDALQQKQALEILRAALDLEPAARGGFVRSRTAGDAVLGAEVMALLEAAAGSDGPIRPGGGIDLLAEAIEGEGPPPAREPVAGGDLPELAGHYRLLRPLGQGAMGTVWLAEQESPRRSVAVKVVRHGLGHSHLRRRFAYEAELLGRLHHPGIAQIFEAGVVDRARADEAYIVMEYIEGRDPVEWAARENLDTGQRLRLVAQMCDAVQHAHQRGVIHRDLKPSNMLVDAAGHVKILDFGVARAVGGDLELTSMHTRAGQIVGTLSYMSPEQVAGEPEDVDTRSDVYALGVIAFQLLAGRLPFDLAGKPLAEAARIIRDEPAPRLGSLVTSLRGDVDTMVGRAMEKDRGRRYAAAADLGDDIRRHIEGLPIAARQDSVFYVLRKQIVRHRTAFAVAVALFAAAVAFAVYAGAEARRFERVADSERSAREGLEIAKNSEAAARARADREAERLRDSLYLANIGIARASILGNEVAGARLALEACPAERRRWEWHYFRKLVDGAATTLDLGIAGWIGGAFFDRGRRGAFALREGHVVVVDTVSMRVESHVVPALASPVGTAIPAPASATVVVSNRARIARVDGMGAIVAQDRREEDRDWTFLAFSDTAGGAFVPRPGGGVVLVDPETLADLVSFPIDGSVAEEVAVSSATGDVHVAAGSGSVFRCRGADGTVLARRDFGAGAVRHVAVSADGRRLAVVVANDRWVRIVDAATLTGDMRVRPHEQWVTAVAWSPDGRYVVTGSMDTTVRFTDVATGDVRSTCCGHRHAVTHLVFPDGDSRLVSASWDGTLRRWEHWDREEPARLDIRGAVCRVANFTPDGSKILIGTEDDRILVFDAVSGEPISEFETGAAALWSLVLPRHSRSVLWPAADGTLRERDFGTGAVRDFARPGDCGALNVRLSSDETLVAVSGPGVVPAVVSFAAGAESRPVPGTEGLDIRVVEFVPGTRDLIAGASRGDVYRIDVSTGRIVRRWKCGSTVFWSVAVAADGRTVALAAADGKIWFVAPGSEEAPVPVDAHRGTTQALAFSPGGDRLVSGGNDGVARLWDVPSRRELLVFQGHRGTVTSASFSPGGDTIVTVCRGGQALVWSLKP